MTPPLPPELNPAEAADWTPEMQEEFLRYCRVLARERLRRFGERISDAASEVAVSLLSGESAERARVRADKALRPLIRNLPQKQVLYYQGTANQEAASFMTEPESSVADGILTEAVVAAVESLDDQTAAMVKFYWGIDSERLPVMEIAEIFEVTRTKVYGVLSDARREMGVRLQGFSGLPQMPAATTPAPLTELEREIISLRERGLSYNEISRRLGCQYKTVEAAIRRSRM